jgi:uncharacterized protein YggT (Ycf19 family)
MAYYHANYSLRDIVVNFIVLITTVFEAFLGLRFLLRLFAANSNTGFVQWIYDMSDALLAPFRGIFPAQVFEGRYVLEFSTLFAMVVYAVIALVLIWIVEAVTPAPAVTRKR